MKDLFEGKHHPKEQEVCRPTRPLEEVSNFVIEQLPQELEYVRNGQAHGDDLRDIAADILRNTSDSIFANALQDPLQRDLAGLDLKILEAAIVHSSSKPPGMLVQLVNKFSQASDQPPIITYEEIILVNPVLDRRTFTNGEIGKSEADFYEGHRLIEGHLDNVVDGIVSGIQILAERNIAGVEEVTQRLQTASAGFTSVIEYMHVIGMKMRREHFAEFRQYLGSHSLRNLKGPSGAFTAGIPTIDLLLAGENLPGEFYAYLEENRMYFPRSGRKGLERARILGQNGLSLVSLTEQLGFPEQLTDPISAISEQVRVFRGHHYRGVKYQIPGAITGDVQGTGGEMDPGTFLRERMKMRHMENK